MGPKKPNFSIRETTIKEVKTLFEQYHPYASTGNLAVYCFAVYEQEKPVAAFLWQPPHRVQARISSQKRLSAF